MCGDDVRLTFLATRPSIIPAKPSLGTSVKTSKRSYHKLDKSKYKLKR